VRAFPAAANSPAFALLADAQRYRR